MLFYEGINKITFYFLKLLKTLGKHSVFKKAPPPKKKGGSPKIAYTYQQRLVGSSFKTLEEFLMLYYCFLL